MGRAGEIIDQFVRAFQSPAWWDYSRCSVDGEQLALGVVRTVAGRLAGVAPVRTCRHPLSFRWSGRELGTTCVRGLTVLGNQPILPDGEAVFVQLIDSLYAAFPECDCISMSGMVARGHCWQLLADSHVLRQHVTVRLSRGTQGHHLVGVPASFDKYLAKFNSKSRYNLRRQLTQLQQKGCGHLELVRVDLAEHVDSYVDRAAAISARSWQGQVLGAVNDKPEEDRRRLALLAKHGVLRCYLLQCGDIDVAFVRGYQYRDLYYYSWCGFDQDFAEYSPGTVLLYLILEDLCNYHSPKELSFLWGDASYKERFGTHRLDDGTALLVRRNARLSNRVRFGLHTLWQASARVAARLAHKK